MRLNGCELYAADVEEPPLLSPWIHHQNSLTDKLHRLSGGSDLDLVFQGWVKPSFWDRQVLAIEEDRLYQREIIMKSRGSICWYARTLIPNVCYTLNPKFFKRLEQESVRHLLFGAKEVRRRQMLSYSVDRHCAEFYWAKRYSPNLDKVLWVRYSEYWLQEQEPFYLLELLFPELEQIQ